MTKRPILLCGGRKAGSSVLPFCGPNGLVDLIRHAHYHYFRDVVRGNQSYDQYVIEFVNGHLYHDEQDAQKKNEHAKNHGIVTHLLNNQKEIVQIHFRSEYELDYMSLQTRIFTSEEEVNYKKPPTPADADVDIPSFDHSFSLEILDLVLRYVNKLRLFKGSVETEEFMAFLDGKPNKEFVSMNNRAVAYFFNTISNLGLICPNWQHVIDRLALITSSSTKGHNLNKSDLSTALSNANYAGRHTGEKPAYVSMIDEMEAKLKKLKGKV